ncbi:hypothetical protein HF086_009761 [Spodoptera exigua]|uniref:Uncharacterized protein n=1 Tax=Spodoptera exigua TaxID=7107 RepID=A0A922SDF3_SPOEX|nr:hypothetical protein HF086_009761 [Spodoptera exigua]
MGTKLGLKGIHSVVEYRLSDYRKQFKDVRLCLLDDALDYLLANNVKVIIDVKGEDKQVEGKRPEKELSNDRPGPLVDKLLEPERKMSSGQN